MLGYLIFDIETIIDEELFNNTANENQKKRYEDPDDPYFVPSIFHVPVAISCLYTTDGKNQDSPFLFSKVNKPYLYFSWVSENPSKLVNRFFEFFSDVIKANKKYKIGKIVKNDQMSFYPYLVSHNGSNFDLPVLYLQAIKYFDQLSDNAKLGLKELLDDEDFYENFRPFYGKKYSKYHIDTNLTFAPYSSLNSLAYLYGIEAKTFMDGSEVSKYFSDKRYKDIAKYCAEDVFVLAQILNKILIAKGNSPLNLPLTYKDECEIQII